MSEEAIPVDAVDLEPRGSWSTAPEATLALAGLLAALGWRGSYDEICEVLPHHTRHVSPVAFRNGLAELGYISRASGRRIAEVDPRLGPVLFETADGQAMYVLARSAEGELHALIDGEFVPETPIGVFEEGTVYTLTLEVSDEPGDAPVAAEWFRALAMRFREAISSVLVISLASNLFAIATPLFVMVVYDRVIGQESGVSLPMLALGILIILMFDFGFRIAKARVLARVAGRLDFLVGSQSFEKLLRLPMARHDRVSVGAQVARLKQFEGLRDFFTSPLAFAAVELPFALLIVAAIAAISGALASIALITGALLIIVSLAWSRHGHLMEKACGRAFAELENFELDTIFHLDTIQRARGREAVTRRYRKLSAAYNDLYERQKLRSSILEAITSFLMSAAALATLVFGAVLVLDGRLSVGGLVAVMALTWRVLSPLQTAALAATKIVDLKATIGQVNRFFRLQSEFRTKTTHLQNPVRAGALAFERVSIRFEGTTEPALMGVSFRAEPGEVVAIAGGSCAGKTSLCKLLMRLYEPQAGRIMIDGSDVRQIDAQALRRAIGYAPQADDFFYGTLGQNLSIARPTATEAEIEAALADVGLTHFLDSLPERLDTRIGDLSSHKIPVGVARQLIIARALVSGSRILVFDEPEHGLDDAGDQAFRALLQKLKGEKTVLLLTHRPSYIAMADKALFLYRGQVVKAGAPSDVISFLFPPDQAAA